MASAVSLLHSMLFTRKPWMNPAKKQVWHLAGLLACSYFNLPSRFTQWHVKLKRFLSPPLEGLGGCFTATGIAPDFNRIPF